ncbi:hypothetical protein ACEWY4_003636 [Coilia grayii]|uniref:AGC-kinase C-terminal domain-containing protein n=1 Tax=Coilia grayii TaxID=363190 RepID=A0ABD1KRT8_9TELE
MSRLAQSVAALSAENREKGRGVAVLSAARRIEHLKNSRDTCNFDREFTKMPTELTPTDKLFIMNLDQDEFLGFSYTNPEYVAPV